MHILLYGLEERDSRTHSPCFQVVKCSILTAQIDFILLLHGHGEGATMFFAGIVISYQ